MAQQLVRMPLSQAIGEDMRAARKKAGLSQRQVAARSGIRRSIVSRLESGRHMPSIESVVRYAQAVGCSPLELLQALSETEPVLRGRKD